MITSAIFELISAHRTRAAIRKEKRTRAARGWQRGGKRRPRPQANPDTTATKPTGCQGSAHAPIQYALMNELIQKQTLLYPQIAPSVIFRPLVL